MRRLNHSTPEELRYQMSGMLYYSQAAARANKTCTWRTPASEALLGRRRRWLLLEHRPRWRGGYVLTRTSSDEWA